MNVFTMSFIVTFFYAVGFSSAADSEKPLKNKEIGIESGLKIDTLVLIAQLVEIPGTVPSNDLYNYVYIMKYRVLKIEKGSYGEKEVLIGQYNPHVSRKHLKKRARNIFSGNLDTFRTGEIHRLVAVTPISSVWNDAVDDEYFDSRLKKFLALKADRY